jgi:hypothetical protein
MILLTSCLCLTLGKAGEYNCVTSFQLTTSIIFLKGTVATLHQLHSLPLDHVPPLIFYYQFEHTFVLDRILFAWALAVTPHWFLGGLSKMVYEHFKKCFISKDPSSRFSDLF